MIRFSSGSRAFVNGVVFQVWVQKGCELKKSVWDMKEVFMTTASQYGSLVQHCQLEVFLMDALFLTDVHVESLNSMILELCWAHPRLAAFIFPLIDSICGDGQEDQTDEWMEIDSNGCKKLNEELLRQCVENIDVLPFNLFSKMAKRAMDQIRTYLETEDPKIDSLGFRLGCSLLSKVFEKMEKAKALNQESFSKIKEAIENLEKERRLPSGKKLKRSIQQLKNVLGQRHVFQTSISNSDASYWLIWEEKIEILGSDWMNVLEHSLEKDWLHSSPRDSFTKSAHRLFGWALATVFCSKGCRQSAFQTEQLEALLDVFFQMLCQRALKNEWLLYSVLSLSISTLSHLEESTQRSLLSMLSRSLSYRKAITEIQKRKELEEWAQKKIVCLVNQLMECKSVHGDVISDASHRRSHLMSWISGIFPFCILFPIQSVQQITLNALLYDSQQKQLIQTLKFLSPVLQNGRDIVLEAVDEIFKEMETLLIENIVSFFTEFIDDERMDLKDAFLRIICIPRFAKFDSASTTLEGLMKSALAILVTSSSQKWMSSVCWSLLESLDPILSAATRPGFTADPNTESIAVAAESLFGECIEILIANKETIANVFTKTLIERCQTQFWRVRIRFLPLISALTDQTESFIDLFLPENNDVHCTASESDIAINGLTTMSQMLWFGSVSETHLTSLLKAWTTSEDSTTLLDRTAGVFVQKMKDLPEALRSWTLVMALVEMVSTTPSHDMNRILSVFLPHFLKNGIHESTSDCDSISILIVEILCRVLFVIGSSSDLSETNRSHILIQGQSQLALFCFEALKEQNIDSEQEIFILRSFMEVASLMTSMKDTIFDVSEMQLLLVQFLKILVKISFQSEAGWVLPSGVSLRLVLSGLCPSIESLRPSSRNQIILSMNKILKDKLNHF